MGLSMHKDSYVRKVIIMIDNVLQIDTTLRPSVVLEVVRQGRVELLVSEDREVVLVLYVLFGPPGLLMHPFLVDSWDEDLL